MHSGQDRVHALPLRFIAIAQFAGHRDGEFIRIREVREQLGMKAEPLVAAISTSEALRFGRRNLEPQELGQLCSSIEESLRKAA